jgi:hypothetical protein
MIGGCVLLVGILAWKLCHVSSPAAVPALTKHWQEQVYSLDEDETIRFVPLPFTPERMTKVSSRHKQLGYLFYSKDRVYDIERNAWAPWEGHPYLFFLVSDILDLPQPPPRQYANLKAALEFAAEGHWPDARVAEELKDIPVDGDWIVRGNTPISQRMTALESILRIVTGRDLQVEYQPLEHDAEDWSLRLDNHDPLNLIKDRKMEPGLILVERKQAR